MVKKPARWMLILAALLLLPAFTLPLWSIRLVAPQYNDGLGMYIGVRDIWGHTQHDIQNINILNHYIGMKPIVPAEVDVLQVMPLALGLLVAGALLAAVVARRWAVTVWLAAFLVLGAAGFYEFYSWNYDYGHNLSPDAPIKVPGMTYQPPMIGTTTLLSIQASSYPSWGTLFLTLAFGAGVAALLRGNYIMGVRDRLRVRLLSSSQTPRRGLRTAAALGGVALLSAAIAACGAGSGGAAEAQAVPAFAPDEPRCDFCDGTIPAERFGGEVITHDGARYRFMSTECLAGFIVTGRVAAEDIRSIRVVDYNHGERLIDATTAHYVRSGQRQSPNGLNLLATETEKVAHNLHFFFHGSRLDWDEVLELVRQEWAS
jgi:copper chaperone NosL